MSPRRLAALSCAAIAAAFAISTGVIALGHGWSFERDLFAVRASGWGALVALALALVASPVGRLAPRMKLRVSGAYVAASRRALGLTAAALATAHGVLALATYLRPALGSALEIPWVRAGIAGWVILLVLGLTSYPRLVRVARVRAWKPLHRLAYLAGFFAFQHALLAPLAPRGWVLLVLGVTLALAPLRALPVRDD